MLSLKLLFKGQVLEMLGFFTIAAAAVPDWVSASFPYIRLVLMIIMVLLSAFMVFCVMTQPAASEGLSAISGGQDTFFGKNKGKTLEGTFKRLTVLTAILLVVVAVLFFVSLIIYAG